MFDIGLIEPNGLRQNVFMYVKYWFTAQFTKWASKNDLNTTDEQ